ncbi:MAG: hypothetical protein ABIB43_05425 [archaeon]
MNKKGMGIREIIYWTIGILILIIVFWAVKKYIIDPSDNFDVLCDNIPGIEAKCLTKDDCTSQGGHNYGAAMGCGAEDSSDSKQICCALG